jgi:hypothetical protein
VPIVQAPCARATCARVRTVVCGEGQVPPAGYCRECERVLPKPRRRCRTRLTAYFNVDGAGVWRGTTAGPPGLESRGLSLPDALEDMARRVREQQRGGPRGAAEPAPAHEVGGCDEAA